jgi:hypothetical protein
MKKYNKMHCLLLGKPTFTFDESNLLISMIWKMIYRYHLPAK